MTASLLRLSRRSTLILPLAAALPGRARAAMLPITDALGRSVTLKAPPERIVVCFNYEEFTAVGGPAAWAKVVGMSKTLWSEWRPSVFRRYSAVIPNLAAMPDVGNTEDGNFSVEKLLTLKPDLLILAEWSFNVLGEQIKQIEALGIPVMVIDYNAQMPARHVASTIALGIATGNEERARTLADLYMAKLGDIQKRVAASVRKPKVYIELGQGGADVIGNTYWKSMWGRMLDLIGADNIAAGKLPGAGGWGPLNPEYVLAANPDVIFIAGSSWVNRPAAVLTGFDADEATTRARLAPYARRKGWDGLTAIRSGELHAVEHGLSRALFDYTALAYLARALYPAQFADVDPVAELRQYHERFLPASFEGTWMTRLTPVGA